MSLEPAESAAIRVTWTDPESQYDLRWYAAAEFVVPLWWIGITDHLSGELERTEVLAPKLEQAGEVFRWLAPVVGHEVARQLVTRAASATLPGPARPDADGPEPGVHGRRRHSREAVGMRRHRSPADSSTAVPIGAGAGSPSGRRPAKAS